MRIGILGTGVVGKTIGTRLVGLGHEVKMGSRSAGNEKAAAWAVSAGKGASEGSFADAASFGEIVFNCTGGLVSLEAVAAAGAKNLAGKILVDVSNPLDFSKGFPPSIAFHGEDSTAEQLQRALPETKLVKSLNTVNAGVMVNPERVAGEHDIFVAGDDAAAKAKVTEILRSFGWKSVVDAGGIAAARGLEAYILTWVHLLGALKTPNFNIRIVK